MIYLAHGEMEIMLTLQTITQGAIILLICISIIVANVLVIIVLATARSSHDVMIYYLMSLAVADLLCGLLVVPLSIYPALTERWDYDHSDFLCRVQGYLQVTLFSAQTYTFMWIGVDRYLAIKKPMRYETMQTRTRCQCWVVFSWVTAALLCSPPLLGYSKADFHPDAYICMLDWSVMIPYTVTLSALVLGPTLITLCYTYSFIFYSMRKAHGSSTPTDKEYASALSENLSNPYHIMSFVLVITFWLSWLPFIGLHLYEQFVEPVHSPLLHFCITWLAFLNSFGKALVYILMSPQFRFSLTMLCSTLCCRWKGRQELIFN